MAMKSMHFSISRLMTAVSMFAMIFAAIANRNELRASLIYTATFGLLLFSLLGACFQQGRKRLFWAGFAVFGWGYLAHILATGVLKPPFLLTTLIMIRLHIRIASPEPGTIIGFFDDDHSWDFPTQISQSLATLVMALLGSVLVRIFGTRPSESDRAENQ